MFNKYLIVMKKTFIIFVFLSFMLFRIEGQPIQRGIRIAYVVNDAQIDFLNAHFQYVITPFLSQDIRDKINGPVLLLYRSIQGTWEGFEQFDWNHINNHENMFCHSDSLNQSSGTRIITIWDSWLMDGNDFVDPALPGAMNHWINYYAITASGQVIAFGYDGLFIDSAGHRLSPNAVYGVMPFDYSDDSWRDGRYAALSYIKTQLPGNLVIFNGLHSDNGADSSLTFTDGGMWEDFAYDINDGRYKGIAKWFSAIECLENNHDSSSLVLVVKKPGLINDLQARVFSVASFLLINNENTVLSLSDYSLQNTMQYYPEYEIDLGDALEEYIMRDDTLFIRHFEKGIVVVNPDSVQSKSFEAAKNFVKIIPQGGGIIDTTAFYDGTLTYEPLENSGLEIAPVSAVILIDTTFVNIAEKNIRSNPLTGIDVYPNPFQKTVNIDLNVCFETPLSITVHNLYGIKIKTLNKGKSPRGKFHFTWNGTGENGLDVLEGIYIIKIIAGGSIREKKVIFTK
jgi:hypothetical protein